MVEFPVANPETVFRQEEDEGILFNPDTGEVFVLNATGTMVYRLCDGRHKEVDMVGEVFESFDDADKDQVARDVKAFLESLESRGFIQEGEKGDR